MFLSSIAIGEVRYPCPQYSTTEHNGIQCSEDFHFLIINYTGALVEPTNSISAMQQENICEKSRYKGSDGNCTDFHTTP